MKVCGKMTNNMVKELKRCSMELLLKGNTSWRRNRDTEGTHGPMGLPMKVDGSITKYTVLEFTSGVMVGVTQASGVRIIWRDMEITYTVMGFSTVGSFRKIRRKGMESISGQMVESIKDGGTVGSSMASVFTLTRNVGPKSTVFGRKANGLGGSKRQRWLQLAKERTSV